MQQEIEAPTGPQILHEAEVHRQHIRLRIPIHVEIDGTRYVADDWSIGGFGVASPFTAHRPGERFPVRLIFPFEDFELTMRLDCQLVYVAADLPRFGAKFLSLSQGQVALFRYLLDAYLAGEIVGGGDILSVVERGGEAEARVQRAFAALDREETQGRRIRRYAGYAALALAGLVLAALVAGGLYERYWVVATDQARIEAPFHPIRATAAGILEPGVQGLMRPGDAAARLRRPDGVLVPIASPCECVLDEWHVPPGQAVRQGEVVATLVAADQPLVARAQLPLPQARRLRVGQMAEVEVPGQDEPYRGQIERIDYKLRPTNPDEPPALGGRRLIPVIIRPDRPFEFEHLGYVVTVRFL